jgi:hypothetical protein
MGTAETSTALRHVTATRYVAPLREGGSLPGLVEADDDGLYVMKFRGAGQGPAALVAEVAAGELAREVGLLVPELVVAELAPELARAEPDIEIQELADASVGDNLGVDFLPGALPFTPAALISMDPALAADLVWFDALVMNVDRTPRNPNLLEWHRALWLIDHGASFFRHHRAEEPGWDASAAAQEPFPAIREHVLIDAAAPLRSVDDRLAGRLDAATLQRIGGLLPPEWADPAPYLEFLDARLRVPRLFVDEADRERDAAR